MPYTRRVRIRVRKNPWNTTLKSDLNLVNQIEPSRATQFTGGFEGRPLHFPSAKKIE